MVIWIRVSVAQSSRAGSTCLIGDEMVMKRCIIMDAMSSGADHETLNRHPCERSCPLVIG